MSAIVTGKFNIHLFVHDLEKAAVWYCDHLGLTMGPYDYNDFVELHANGQFFMHLFKDSQLAPVPKPMFYLDSADIEFAYRSFKDKGVQVSKLMRFPDHSSFVFTDLDGNKVGMSHFD